MDWDSQQQLLRKASDALAGGLLAWGVITGDMLPYVGSAIFGVISLGWWIVWNRNRPAAPAA